MATYLIINQLKKYKWRQTVSPSHMPVKFLTDQVSKTVLQSVIWIGLTVTHIRCAICTLEISFNPNILLSAEGCWNKIVHWLQDYSDICLWLLSVAKIALCMLWIVLSDNWQEVFAFSHTYIQHYLSPLQVWTISAHKGSVLCVSFFFLLHFVLWLNQGDSSYFPSEKKSTLMQHQDVQLELLQHPFKFQSAEKFEKKN